MKHYLLVAGVDYKFKVDFRYFCDNRMKRALARTKAGEEITFKIFDVRKGEIITHEIAYSRSQRLTKSSKTQPFKPVTKTHYDSDHNFKDGNRDVMSAVDIYKGVQDIGTSSPGTLVELSFFSHGWMGGPILVNSYDDNVANGTRLIGNERDPDDKDPRATKDFIAPTMDATALANFQKAFQSSGYIWIWGCAFPRVVHEILHKLEHHRLYRASGLGDDVDFEFTNFNPDHVAMLEDWLRGVAGPFPNKRKVALKFKHLKYFFCRVSAASYTHHIARNANVKAYGALMGTYSDYDRGRLPLLSVHSGFAPHLRFYKNYLGFDLDPEGRRYGKYLPGFACTAPAP